MIVGKKLIVVLVVVLAVFITGLFSIFSGDSSVPVLSEKIEQTKVEINTLTENAVQSKPNQGAQNDLYLVTKVVDGDTVSVDANGELKTLRLIGINTPETVDPRKPVECFGKEASAKAKELLLGKRVRIEKDQSQGELDKYGRTLAYIFLENGISFNKYIIENGYAYEYTYNLPYKYQTEFKVAQKQAQELKKGLWGDGVCSGTPVPPTTAPATQPPASNSLFQPTQNNEQYVCSYNAYNCGDFSTHAEAQEVFEFCGGSGQDIHKLDGSDNDGKACESLP